MSQATFWNLIARKYARDPIADQTSYDTKLALTRALLRPQMRLLEVGCGTGSTALIHAPHVRQIDAIDFSHAMIAIAQGKARDQGVGNVTFRVAGLDDLPPSGDYDMVLGLSLLHLLRDPAAGLARMAAQVGSGGYVVTSTACLRDMPGLLPRIVPLIGRTGLIPRAASLTRTDLDTAHRAAGLVIVEDFQPRPDAARFLIAQKPR